MIGLRQRPEINRSVGNSVWWSGALALVGVNVVPGKCTGLPQSWGVREFPKIRLKNYNYVWRRL